MLKIQVLGSGLIPRGYGLAPRKEPFPADLTLIHTIMSTPGLRVNMITPDDNRTIELNNGNLKRLWDKYKNYQATAPARTTITNPVTPKTPEQMKPVNAVQEEVKPQPVTPVVPQNLDVKKEELVEDKKVEDKKDSQPPKAQENTKDVNGGLKPIISDDKKNQQNNKH